MTLYSKYTSGTQITAGTIVGNLEGGSGLNNITDRINSITTADGVVSGTSVSYFGAGTISGTSVKTYGQSFQEDGWELSNSAVDTNSSTDTGSHAFKDLHVYKWDDNQFSQNDFLRVMISANHNNNGSAVMKLVFSGASNIETPERDVPLSDDIFMDVNLYGGWAGAWMSEITNTTGGILSSFNAGTNTIDLDSAGSLILTGENSATDFQTQMNVQRITN